MNKKISIGAAAVILLLAVLITFQVTFLTVSNKYRQVINDLEASEHFLYDKLSTVDELFRSLYIGEINEEQLVDAVISGYISGTGDKYAQYMNTDEFADFQSDLNQEFDGIGIIVAYNDKYMALEVVAVMPNSPALTAGLLPGDLIIQIGSVDTSALGYYASIDALKGFAGTKAEFVIARGNDYSEKIEMSVERAKVESTNVMSHMYDDGTNSIGIIRILQFYPGVAEQLKISVESLRAEGASKFVFDVRANPGGELNSVVEVLDYLLPAGPVIRITDAQGNESVLSSNAGELEAEMIVLVNKSTASAAELFAAALRDYGKAKLVGETTYGKGSMQQIVRLEDNSALRVTYRMYSPPYSANYDGVGLVPDYKVQLSEEMQNKNIYTIADNDDAQLLYAIEKLGAN